MWILDLPEFSCETLHFIVILDNTIVEKLRAICLDHAKLGESSLSSSLDTLFFGQSASQVLYLTEVCECNSCFCELMRMCCIFPDCAFIRGQSFYDETQYSCMFLISRLFMPCWCLPMHPWEKMLVTFSTTSWKVGVCHLCWACLPGIIFCQMLTWKQGGVHTLMHWKSPNCCLLQLVMGMSGLLLKLASLLKEQILCHR